MKAGKTWLLTSLWENQEFTVKYSEYLTESVLSSGKKKMSEKISTILQ